ncbi:terminase small subunit [Methylobacterium sp. E-005]|uniref:terminase small subunit n=1 Tax=Methylobacterium sp. E-005 TaxID=2836549 RepID=UPI001FB9B378|nr:terminase small subunit [Methylobacterium sp. E-005]MCJ2084617.1 terminase small subunit [Methylobacterium sp. E-005]
MPVLSNSKHERFAQAVAEGQSASQAYVTAGYAANEGNAGRLNRNERVRARIEEILQAGAEKAGVTVARIVEELAKVGFANMQDYMRASPAGDPYLDFSGLTRDQAAALGEVTVEDFKDGRGEDARDVRRVKFKLHDKLSALEKLGKHLGMFKDPDVNANITVNLAPSDADL